MDSEPLGEPPDLPDLMDVIHPSPILFDRAKQQLADLINQSHIAYVRIGLKTNRKMKPSIDVDSLRTEHESDEQWDVRRSFMIEHKDNFDEAELITLAQLFTNIEFLGCRYPQQTMLRIANLAEKVSAKYKESRKNKLKRTFVEASDAAEQKAKRTFK